MKMIFIKSKCFSNLLQLEPCIDLFNIISGTMAHWYETINTIIISVMQCK